MIGTAIIAARKPEREKIASLLAASGDIKVLAQGQDAYDALKIVGSLKPEIAVLDNEIEFIQGEEIPPLLKMRSPSTAVALMAARISDERLCRALSNEVAGFIHKESDLEALPGILARISKDGCFISPAFALRILRLFSRVSAGAAQDGMRAKCGCVHAAKDPVGRFSKIELRVLFCLGKGYTSEETARSLGVTAGTARNYISSVMRKTGLKNRSQMARYALANGLVPFDSGFPDKPSRKSAGNLPYSTEKLTIVTRETSWLEADG